MPLERRQVRRAREPLRLVVEARLARRRRQPLDRRPREGRQRPDALREQVGDVGVVAAEQLVAALARERDLHVLGGELGDEVGRERGRVGERLVERRRERRQEQRRVGPEHELAVVRPVARRHRARTRQLVERRLLEADRERAHGLGALLAPRAQPARPSRRRPRAARRPARPRRDAPAPSRAGAHGTPRRAPPRRRRRAEPGPGPRVALERDAAVVPRQDVPRRQLADLPEDRERRRDRVEGEERLERVEVDLTAGQRVELGRERERDVVEAVVEGLDPEPVPREHEPPPRRVPDRDGEHAAQPRREPGSPLLVRVDEHLGVRPRREAMAGARELAGQLAVVVDLAVLDDRRGAVLVRDRLIARLEVDDREPPRREARSAVHEHALGVRPAVHERRPTWRRADRGRRGPEPRRLRRSRTRVESIPGLRRLFALSRAAGCGRITRLR